MPDRFRTITGSGSESPPPPPGRSGLARSPSVNGTCDVCAIDLSGPTVGYEVRLDLRREFAMGTDLLLRVVRTGTHRYCTACAASAPDSRIDNVTVAG